MTMQIRGRWRVVAALAGMALLATVLATSSPTAAQASYTITVRAKATVARGTGAEMVVYVDGVIATPSVVEVTSTTFEDFSFTADNLVDGSQVDIAYVNDLTHKKVDRNLFVQSITVDGTTILATDEGVILDNGSGEAAFDGVDTQPGQEALYGDGALRFTVSVSPPPPPPPPPPPSEGETITVRAKGSPAGGIWPTMQLYVNGELASPDTVTVAETSYGDYTFTASSVPDPATIDVVFNNDAWLDPEDRNLWVESITVGATTYPSTGSNVIVDRGSGEAAFDGVDTMAGQEALYWDAALRFSIEGNGGGGGQSGRTGEIIVRAKSTFAVGEWSKMVVTVNGATASPSVVTVDDASLADYAFSTDNMTDTPVIFVTFINDRWAPGEDGNLFIDSITVDGMRIQSDEADRVTVDWGWGIEAATDGIDTGPGQYALWYGGSLRYDATPRPEPVRPSPREPLAATETYYQDFSGGVIDNNWTLYNELGNAGWGLRRPSAFQVVDSAEAEAGGKLVQVTAQMGTGPESDQLVSGGMALHKKAQTYGRFTVRVKTDPDPDRVTTGVVLMWPQSNNWPQDGEIDWYEGWRDRFTRTPIELISHYVIDGVHDADEVTLLDPTGVPVDGSEWHTYQLDWRPDYLAVSVDGGTPNVLTTDPAKIPDNPMHMTIQLDAWESFVNPGEQPTISAPVSMWADWVRVEAYDPADL